MKLAFLKRDPTLVSENVHDQRKILDSENFEFNIFSYRSVVNIYAHICRGMGRVEGGTLCTLSKDFGLKNTMKHENRRPHPQIFSQLPSKKFDNNFASKVVSSF
jgi:hypothetical protein